MQALFWVIDLLVPATLLGFGLYYRYGKPRAGTFDAQTAGTRLEPTRAAGKLMIAFGALLVAGTVAAKVFAPLEDVMLALILVGAQLLVFVCVALFASSKINV